MNIEMITSIGWLTKISGIELIACTSHNSDGIRILTNKRKFDNCKNDKEKMKVLFIEEVHKELEKIECSLISDDKSQFIDNASNLIEEIKEMVEPEELQEIIKFLLKRESYKYTDMSNSLQIDPI